MVDFYLQMRRQQIVIKYVDVHGNILMLTRLRPYFVMKTAVYPHLNHSQVIFEVRHVQYADLTRIVETETASFCHFPQFVI